VSSSFDPVGHVTALLRTWPGRLIAVVVVTQLAIPLTYYVARRDPHDERFAWRMFSPMRMAQCKPTVTIDGKPFALESAFHEAWLAIANRGRFVVVEAMGARLCEKNPGKSVVVALDCSYIGEAAQRYGGYDMCTVPEL